MKKILLLSVALILSQSVFAGSFEQVKNEIKGIEATEKACLNSDDGMTTVGMRECLNNSYSALDKILNREYKKMISELKKPSTDDQERKVYTLRTLQASQRAWLAYRDTNVDFYGSSEFGGTLSLVIMDSKAVEMLKARILEIMDVYYGPQ